MKLKPLADRIVAKSLEAEAKTKSGIFIPDTAKEKPQIAEVIAVGPGKVDDNGNRIPVDVKVGDKIMHSQYGPDKVKVEGEEFIILEAKDVLAVVEK